MVLGEVVGEVRGTWVPVYTEHFLGFLASHPEEAHVPRPIFYYGQGYNNVELILYFYDGYRHWVLDMLWLYLNDLGEIGVILAIQLVV